MASTNQTGSYKLSQWVETDPVLREDFNADNRKIESALVSLQTATNECRVVAGDFLGSGYHTTQTINLGFKPKVVFLVPRGMMTYGAVATVNSSSQGLSIIDSGFQVSQYQNATDQQSSSGVNPYRYLAFH